MSDNLDNLKKLIPLSKVVNASIIDLYGDIGAMQQLHYHWAARGLKKLQSETLKSGKRNCFIVFNQNTRTAMLPPDFDEELFIGYINELGQKVPIPLNTNLVNTNSIVTIECEDACAKCGQDKGICNDLTVTESTEIVVVGETTAEKITIKKLYLDGSYYLETTIPYWDIQNSVVAYATTKEFIATIDLKDCGCINPTTENIAVIKDCCYDCYCSYFSPCSSVCDTNVGSYKIIEEAGLIQFDYKFRHAKVYIEYRGFIPKLNGQLAVPEVAFETLVEWVKFKSLEGKMSVSNPDKKWRLDMYRIARSNMNLVMGRMSFESIMNIISLTPKFDWATPSWNNFCAVPASNIVTVTNASLTGCETSAVACSASGTTPILTPFKLAVIVPAGVVTGLPVAGATSWQNDIFIGALNLENIIVNNGNESKNLGNFTFDNVTGTINRSPNIFFEGDSIITDFNKMV